LYMVQNLIWDGGLEHGDMIDRVNTTEGVRKTEGVLGVRSCLCKDFKQA
jgi:hypothetical protein